MYDRLRHAPGFTIIEMVIVMLLFGVMAAVTVPRAMRTSPHQEVHQAARQVMRDLESARLRAISAKRVVRVSFYTSKKFYAAFMDVTSDRTGVISETVSEARASRFLVRASDSGIPGADVSKRVKFGVGGASSGPRGESLSGPVAFDDDRLEFDPRGMLRPVAGVRKGGVILITHEDDPSLVSAVTVTGSGAFRTWDYRDGEWR
jgi:prepilin-type N-terminal cleavage/methylation domain-containing protein